MKIVRKDKVGIIGEYDPDTDYRLCPNCLEHGSHSALGDKIIPVGQEKQRGDELFMSCTSCYKTYPKYQTKVESEVTDIIESVYSPFNQGNEMVGINNKRSDETPLQKQRRKQLAEADKEPDLEIRALKRSGVKVTVVDSTDNFDWNSLWENIGDY